MKDVSPAATYVSLIPRFESRASIEPQGNGEGVAVDLAGDDAIDNSIKIHPPVRFKCGKLSFCLQGCL